ncbi:WAP four-disulfide core domain protein 2 [Macrotis lagotis]|uniref:WAP four-disulfide core domain protein 2 n=1 Tax=Macrotis lagotis TaxID=92651 RepID=UPI003D690C06
MARQLAPFSAFFSGLCLFFLLDLAPASGQNHTLDPVIWQNRTEAEKEGVCPETRETFDCPNECKTDGDCPEILKCCTVGCTSICRIPNEKKGKCPDGSSSISLLGFCKDECSEDTDCSGTLKCCINGCGNFSCLSPED